MSAKTKKRNRARRRKGRSVEVAKTVTGKAKRPKPTQMPEPEETKPFDAIAAAIDALTLEELQAIGAVGYDAVEPRKQ